MKLVYCWCFETPWERTLETMEWQDLLCPCRVSMLDFIGTCFYRVEKEVLTWLHLAVKYYNPVTSLCMLRCGTEEYRQVKTFTQIVWIAANLLSSKVDL